ncbi:hypothetical protein FQA39_LY18391 [Lamprigera yunnana]|nr:hypothetical protein FQA39_LY18391 [Lamprigera yunnana]
MDVSSDSISSNNSMLSLLNSADEDSVSYSACNDGDHWMDKADRLELLNSKLRLDLGRLKIDYETKNTSVVGLKRKIVDLHLEIQMLTQSNGKLNNDLHMMHNSFKSLKKSETWYREQLHLTRNQKSKISHELARLRSILIGKESARSNELTQYSDADENTIQSLHLELVGLKNGIEIQKRAYNDLVKCNSDLKQLLKDKDTLVRNLNNNRKELTDKIETLQTNFKENSNYLIEVLNEKSRMEIALEQSQRDKNKIENAISTIKIKFSQLILKYNSKKSELVRLKCNIKETDKLEEVVRNLKSEVKAADETLKLARKEKDNETNKTESLTEQIHKLNDKYLTINERNTTLDEKNKQLMDENKLHRQLLHRLKNRLQRIEVRCDTLQQQNLTDGNEITELKKMNELERANESEHMKGLRALCCAKDMEMQEKREKRVEVIFVLNGDCDKYLTINQRNTTLDEKNKQLMDENKLHRQLLHRLKNRLQRIEVRCDTLQQQNLTDGNEITELKKMNELERANESEHMKGLRALCCAKDMEMQEKREKYELNCHTLLAKVNEQKSRATAVEQRLQHLKQLQRVLQEELNNCKVQELSKDLRIEHLNKEEQLEATVKKLQMDNDLKRADNRLLKESNRKLNITIDELKKTFAVTEKEAQLLLRQVEVGNQLLTKEVKNLTADLERRANELSNRNEVNVSLKKELRQKETAIEDLTSELQLLQDYLATVKSDKYFLQRLCNDLKFALTTTKNQSEVLKKHLDTLTSDYGSLSSLEISLPSPCQFDDTYIQELLEQSVCHMAEPLSNLHASLSLLKKEMVILRKQVVECIL